MHVPTIDIAPFLDGSARAAVAARVARTFEEIEFLAVTGHGIPVQIVERAFERSRAFFDLPQERKDPRHPTVPSRQRGYHGFATRGLAYTLGEKAPPNLREPYFLGPIDDHRDHFRSQPVRPPRGALVVNLGDMMTRWTSDRWTSALHRVGNPRELGSARSHRRTIGFFLHRDFEATIEAIPSCGPPNEAPKYPPISAGAHIAMKITSSHEGVRA